MTQDARPAAAGGLRPVVVGVAGHIDHGKSTLVRALTGTDPDRLPEEKRRGITIDLGFAHLDLEDISLSFVDAPGHEKFVHNMLAGATGIDVLLLVVAADESVMPQTREHLGICRLLDIHSGVVALTRIDLADGDLVALAEDDVRRLTRGTFLADAPIVRVSGATGEGLPELRTALLATARRTAPRASGPWPRLPIDRVFAAKGFGTVVTGTLSGGLLKVGETLIALPGDLEGRVRGLQVHGAAAQQAGHGRVAVNLQGIPRERLTRGMVLTPPGRQVVATLFDARVEVLDEAPAALTDGQRVRVHHGSAEVMGRLRLPAPGRIAPGRPGVCQVRLETPLAVLPGDRFVLRRYSPVTTLGGGVVVDLDPPRWRRSDERWPAQVNVLAGGDAAARLASAAFVAGDEGISVTSRATRLGLEPPRALELAQAVAAGKGSTVAPVILLGGERLVSREALEKLTDRLTAALSRAHRERPLESGVALEPLRAQVAPAWDAASFRDWLARLEAGGLIGVSAEGVRLGGHTVELAGADKALYGRMTQVLEGVGLFAAPEDEWLQQSGAGREGKRLVTFAVKRGDAIRLKDGAFVSGLAWRGMVERLRREAAAGRATFSVPEFKEWFSLTRKHAIPLLEKLDDAGVTQRVGDQRRIRPA